MIISKTIEFDYGHRVPGHTTDGKPGQCSSPHGHRGRVEVTVDGRVAETGMVLDFAIVKQAMMAHVHDVFDHAMVIASTDKELMSAMNGHAWKIAVMTEAPTAENLAIEIVRRLSPVLAARGVQLVKVVFWETPTSCATWSAV